MTRSVFRKLEAACQRLVGPFNAHYIWIVRTTLENIYVDLNGADILQTSDISLQKKHSLISTIHCSPAYREDDLCARVDDTVGVMRRCGTRRVRHHGRRHRQRGRAAGGALVNAHAAEQRPSIAIRTWAYSPFGFKDSEPQGWTVFEQGVTEADFIGCLPETNDRLDYPDHIGFDEHCVRMLDWAQRTGKMLHVHVDQRNVPQEDGTERLIAAARRFPRMELGDCPRFWAVHMVSPSTCADVRWERMLAGLLKTNTGVICCPSTALGMRQIRPVAGPTYNSIPRVVEVAAAGVPIRLDRTTSPTSARHRPRPISMMRCSACPRPFAFCDTAILANFAAGVALDGAERDDITRHLARNDQEIARVMARWDISA